MKNSFWWIPLLTVSTRCEETWGHVSLHPVLSTWTTISESRTWKLHFWPTDSQCVACVFGEEWDKSAVCIFVFHLSHTSCNPFPLTTETRYWPHFRMMNMQPFSSLMSVCGFCALFTMRPSFFSVRDFPYSYVCTVLLHCVFHRNKPSHLNASWLMSLFQTV